MNDTTVWTKDESSHVEPTEETEGKDVYTGEYGTVEVILPKKPHEHSMKLVPEKPATKEEYGVMAAARISLTKMAGKRQRRTGLKLESLKK